MERERGRIVWHDLITPDRERCLQFYHRVFGWEARDWEGGNYTVLSGQGRNFGGIPWRHPAGSPSYWLAYPWVDDVDATVDRATRMGGRALVQPMDLPEIGRMAVVADPQGGVMAPFHAKSDHPAPVTHHPALPGDFCWYQLTAPDPGALAGFYSELYGWRIDRSDQEDRPHWEIRIGGRLCADIVQTPEGQAGAAGWIPYVAVRDVDAANDLAARMGGRTVIRPRDLPALGRYAVVNDPTGALFGLWQGRGTARQP